MPSGFSNALFAGKSANTFGLNTNCYYCTIAALLGKTVGDLFKATETMQQDTAVESEVLSLFKAAGVDADYYSFFSVSSAYHTLKALSLGHSYGLGYRRLDGTRHMVVATRDQGYVNNFENEGIKCVDYQQSPPKVTGFPPEPNITNYWVFYRK